MDKPTTDLHFEDVKRLLAVPYKLANAGNTLVGVEHNLNVIKAADWVIDLGPEAEQQADKSWRKGDRNR